MNLQDKLKELKKCRETANMIKKYKQTNGKIVTARDMKNYIAMGVIPVPIYTKGIEYKQIVDVRTIYASPKRKKKIK